MAKHPTPLELAQLAAPLLAALKVANATHHGEQYRNFASLTGEAIEGADELYKESVAYVATNYPSEPAGAPTMVPL